MIEQKILQDFRWFILLGLFGLNWFSSDGTRYVRPFVIFRDCIQKVVQFTEPAVINYGLCGKFRASRTLPVKTEPFSVLKDYYHFMSVERPIINTSLVLDPPFRYHVTDPTCNRANIRCMDFLRKVSSFQVNRWSSDFLNLIFITSVHVLGKIQIR